MVPHVQLPRLWEEGQVDPFFEGREGRERGAARKKSRDLTTTDPVKIAQ